MIDYTITDYEGRTIEVGTRVCMFDHLPGVSQTDDDANIGKVLDLGEWDGDVDDYGRSVGIPPRVTVLFGDGTKESFATSDWEWETAYDPGGPTREPVSGKVEDIVVLS